MTSIGLATHLTPQGGLESQSRQAENLHRLLADHARDGILCLSLDGQMRFASPMLRTMIGRSIEGVLACDHRTLVHPDDWSDVAWALAGLHAGNAGATCRYRYIRQDGLHVWVEGHFQIASSGYGLGAAFVGNIRDITDRRRLEEQLAAAQAELAQVSATDGLTRLLSRGRFDEVLRAEWARGARDEQPLSLLLLEVDQFEAYTEAHGLEAGDKVLRIVAACVQGRPRRATDIAARYGGEVFAVLMPHTDGFGAMMMAEQVRNAVLDRILPHPGSACGVLTVSIGVATLTPSHDKIPAALVGRAGVALAEAGRLGSNRIEADAAVVAVSNDIGNPSRGDTENPSTPATVTPRLVPVRVSP